MLAPKLPLVGQAVYVPLYFSITFVPEFPALDG
jgi:hypothetical protein